MRIGISNIAWRSDEDAAVYALLKDEGIFCIEIAPTRIWPDPVCVDVAVVANFQLELAQKELVPVAMQSLLYGRPDLTIFESASAREATLAYLQKIINLGGRLGVQSLVFGSPKNRIMPEIFLEESRKIAIHFFGALAQEADKNKVMFCIEPNSVQYGTNFINNTAEAVTFIKDVGLKGLGLHLDAGVIILNAEEIHDAVAVALPHLVSFHVSEPFLEPVGQAHEKEHSLLAACLKRGGYGGVVSIEMRAQPTGSNLNRIKESIKFTKRIYE